ncbi:MAG: hypothetical protein HFF18_02550 [Oscillospiraceae bacterium]|nr:hypothetical protein [Oscillospiraceae bacterium]
MRYAISDLHGCYDKYQALLKKICFGPEDTLYVLGDVLDRGPDGFRILLDMAGRSNVVGLLGNHEAMAIQALPGLLGAGGPDWEGKAELWFQNGGEASVTGFLQLSAGEMRRAWDYLLSMPLYWELEAGGRRFVLLHDGLKGFSPNRPLKDYGQDEILW